jgi:hypothetical protein
MEEYEVNGELEAARECSKDQTEQIITTLMIRNLPLCMTSEEFMGILDEIGLSGTYDYVFMPTTRKRTSKGYVFVNFSLKVEPSELQSALSGILCHTRRIVVVPAIYQGVLTNLRQVVSVDLDILEASFFHEMWVRIDHVLKPIAAFGCADGL